MSHDMHDEIERQPVLQLRVDHFNLVTRILGCESDTARAELIGVTVRTIQRARAGEQIGEVFIARAVVALRRHADELARYNLSVTLDALFEVVEQPALAAAA